MSGLSFPPVYLPWGPWAPTPEEVQHITSLLYGIDAKVYVEVGSGVSTLCVLWAMAHMHDPLERMVITFEEDENWQKNIMHSVAMLRSLVNGSPRFRVYDTVQKQHLGEFPCVDVLFIDGPSTAFSRYESRMITLDIVDAVTHGGFIFVDDTNRQGEQRLVASIAEKGFANVYRNERYTVLQRLLRKDSP